MNPSDRIRGAARVTRRGILRLSGGAAAASALAGVDLPAVHAAGGETIRLALIGCGNRGSGAVADAFSTTGGVVKLHAMADLFEDRLERSRKALGEAHADKMDVPPERRFVGFDAYRGAIDSLGSGDVALLTTHAVFRPVHFEYAVRRGVNVFMEKSFAVDAPAVRRLLASAALSEEKGLKVATGFMWRHSKARQEVIRRIHDGAIGELHTLRIYRVHGPVHCPPLPRGAHELTFQLRNAPRFNWTTGGFFVDWHCHNVDVACWAKNAWPVSAQGFGGRTYVEAGNLFDHYAVEYTFADGAKLFAFSRHMPGCWETYSDHAHGSRAAALIMASLRDPAPCIYRDQRMEDANVAWRYPERDNNPYHAEWQVLLDAIRAGRPHNEARRAAEADLVAIMGRMATHTGQMVSWDQAMNSRFQYCADVDRMTLDTPPPISAGPDGIYPAPVPGKSKEI